MSNHWVNTILERINGGAHADGGWGYSPAAAPSAEPTALVCLALSARKVEEDVVRKGLALLARLQRSDGRVPVASNIESTSWPTGLAVLAWSFRESNSASRYRPQTEKAVDWLLRTHRKPIQSNSTVFGHDTTLNGWSWLRTLTRGWNRPHTPYSPSARRE